MTRKLKTERKVEKKNRQKSTEFFLGAQPKNFKK